MPVVKLLLSEETKVTILSVTSLVEISTSCGMVPATLIVVILFTRSLQETSIFVVTDVMKINHYTLIILVWILAFCLTKRESNGAEISATILARLTGTSIGMVRV